MNSCLCLVLSVLSIWDYPLRQNAHDMLRRQFVVSMQKHDTAAMERICRSGVKLLPEDPVWRYNLACSLAYVPDRQGAAFDELKTAIDLGFRDSDAIAKDTDLKQLETLPRYRDLIAYAERMKTVAVTSGPSAAVVRTGTFGKPVVLAATNLCWDLDAGLFVARMKLEKPAEAGGNAGDLYMNRDGMHSSPNLREFPGITSVALDREGREKGMQLNFPNMLFPYPVFGNCSRAFVQGPLWRSLPRMLMTQQKGDLGRMVKTYLSNQTWVYPANADIAPIGTNGDVFASITPYWITTAGRSWSDLPYLRAALEASRSLQPPVKDEIVKRGLLAPTIQTLIRKSLKGVTNEVAYLGARAHPTAFPPNAVETKRLKAAAKALAVEAIPPLAVIAVKPDPIEEKLPAGELTYGSAFAWAWVLRAEQAKRVFTIFAQGAEEFAFVQTHGTGVDVEIEKLKPNVAKVTIDRRGMSPTNRVDITVVGRNAKTGWGAPSYVSFARMDPAAPYSDPALTLRPEPPKAPAKKRPEKAK